MIFFNSKVLYKTYLLNAILFELMLGPVPVLSLLISLLSLIKILLSLLSKILPSFLPTKSAILTLPRVSGCSPWCALAVSSQFSQRRVRPRLRGSELWIRQGGKADKSDQFDANNFRITTSTASSALTVASC